MQLVNGVKNLSLHALRFPQIANNHPNPSKFTDAFRRPQMNAQQS